MTESAIMFLLTTERAPVLASRRMPRFRRDGPRQSSAAPRRLRPGCSAGSFRNHAAHTATHTKPRCRTRRKSPATTGSGAARAPVPASGRRRGAHPRRRCPGPFPVRAGESSGKTSARRTATRRPHRPRKKPDGQQDGIAERGACCRREARPPDHDTRQHGPRALPVCPPRRGNLEQRICQLKDCEDVTHLDGGQSKVAHDPWRQARDAGAIQVRNHRKRGAEGNDAIPRVSGRSHSRALYANFTSSSSMANANQHGALLGALRFPGRGPRLTRTGWPAARGERPASHRGRGGAPPARRDDREYRPVFEEEATQPAGMHRRPNAAGLSLRTARSASR